MFTRHNIVVLCGSTKFKEEFLEYERKFTLQGYVVLSIFIYGHSGDEDVITCDVKNMLDELQLQQIHMADEVFVINKYGYIGESTRKQIEYAKKLGKPVNYLIPIENNDMAIKVINILKPIITYCCPEQCIDIEDVQCIGDCEVCRTEYARKKLNEIGLGGIL